MSEEGRRVFNMETILSLINGKGGDDVSDLLGFLSQRDLSPQEEGVVAILARAWLFSQHPPFMESTYDESGIWEDFVKKEKSRLGDNVSLTPIPEAEMAQINTVLDSMASQKATIAEQQEKIAGLEGTVAELEPFKAQAADLEKKVAQLEEKVAGLEEQNAELKKQTKEFEGKLAINEGDLESTVKDIVSKAVKDAVAAMPKAAPGEAAAVGEEAPAAAEEEAGGPPEDFGFGDSGGDSSGFGF